MNIIQTGMRLELEHTLKCGKHPITGDKLTKAQREHIKALLKGLE